jgi:hypothetical protein
VCAPKPWPGTFAGLVGLGRYIAVLSFRALPLNNDPQGADQDQDEMGTEVLFELFNVEKVGSESGPRRAELSVSVVV